MNKSSESRIAQVKTIGIHLLVWACYVLYESSILFYIAPQSLHWLQILFSFILNAAVFYTNVGYLLPSFARVGRYWFLPFGLLVVIGLYIGASYYQSKYLSVLIDPSLTNNDVLGKMFIAQRIYRACYFIALSFGYWFAVKSIESEIKLREAQKLHYLELLDQEELKKQIAVSRLTMYRSQLNPHFLFNTLNFFYSNIYPLSRELAQSIILLSNLLRYISLRNVEDNFVELSGEIDLIDVYLKLNQLRFENKLKIEFEVTGIIEHKKIPPFIMMTIIENAFKYGELSNADFPLIIRLRISATKLEFMTENLINKDKQEDSQGIGLSNVRKQLDLIYSSDYSLVTCEANNKFKCCLELNLLC